jgi:methanogenic corrinoid protein MtbC1
MEFRMHDLDNSRSADRGRLEGRGRGHPGRLADGVAPLTIVTGHLMPAMDEVGRRFECEEYFVPEMLLSARAMKASMEILRPLLARAAPSRWGAW